MAKNRIFLPQEALDHWLAEGRADISADTLTVKADGSKYAIRSAVRFMSEMAGGGDVQKLVGKVKEIEQIQKIGGEHVSDSVILADDAYQVVEGFVCEPLTEASTAIADLIGGSSLESAAAAAAGETATPAGEIDLLTRFFLQSR
jgi:hypothetical protein